MIRPFDPAPDWTLGLWRRTVVEGVGVDETERAKIVYWAQTPFAFVDLRVPVITAADTEKPEAQDGFAGHISFSGDVCTWHRMIDIRPRDTPDRAVLKRAGNTLYETGDGYCEEFAMVSAGLSRCLGFTSEDGMNILVVIDNVFLSAARQAKPNGVAEVAMGHASPRWRIDQSTVPGRRGMMLFENNPAVPEVGSFKAQQGGKTFVFHALSALRDKALPDDPPFSAT